MSIKKESQNNLQYSRISISLASPDSILTHSFGEVTKPETINHRTYKPEREGLFCERIFGPVKDYECACGKYKRIRYKALICDRCGVQVTEKRVRRERMGHIKLVAPVVHPWYFKSLPNKIGYMLGMSSKRLESVIYYENYVVVQAGILEQKGVQKGELLTEERYSELMKCFVNPEDELYDRAEFRENQMLPDSDPDKFVAKMGAEAVKDLLEAIDIKALYHELKNVINTESSQQRKTDALKRLSIVEAFRKAQGHMDNRPEWMVLQYVPVIPPELRPLVPLDGGRFASADLNDLYRRLIIRNNRLKRLVEIKAPEVILRNEKRMLQEAVDALIDNSKKSTAVKTEGGRPYKSLSEVLKGKQGRFRQNLLGKRVDYSGRSVIVVGPELQLHECGLPKDMAAELFKPFIISRLLDRGIVKTAKSGKRLVDEKDPVIWDILENVLKGHPVLLNRAPTLHRLSIQAFQPRLIEGKAIQLHPLVCSAFNADFDGDQMAVHVPLSHEALLEAQTLMLSSHNILNPQNGTAVTLPSQDMVLGLYYLSKIKYTTDTEKVLGEGKIFYAPEEVIIAYNEKKVDLHAAIKVKVALLEEGKMVRRVMETSVGRVLFNQLVPPSVGFINQLLTKKELQKIIGDIIRLTDIPQTVKFLDGIKMMGFRMAFMGGLSFSINDLLIPMDRDELIEKAQMEVEEVRGNYNMGFITNKERYNQVLDIWSKADTRITDKLLQVMRADKQGFNSVYMMLDSGARGSKQQVKQLMGIRGLMAKARKSGGASGSEIVENPILTNFKQGLKALDYFISTHGARKGLTDTALKTADAGYLTRRLVDVAQDVVIADEDCKTLRGIKMGALLDQDENVIETLSDRIEGRVSLYEVRHPQTKEVLVAAGVEITAAIAQKIEQAEVKELEIRSVLTCESRRGVCVKCYGKHLATGSLAQRGDAVGIIAAQSIGEPGTQLTLRTFHMGGIAGSTVVKSEIRSKYEGTIKFEKERYIFNEEGHKVVVKPGELVVAAAEAVLATYDVPYGATLYVADGQVIQKGDLICVWDPINQVKVAELSGEVSFEMARRSVRGDIREQISALLIRDSKTGQEERYVLAEDKETQVLWPSSSEKKGKLLARIKGGQEIRYIESEDISEYRRGKPFGVVKKGDVIARTPRSRTMVRDITGGLPRITELFEARSPSSVAVVSEIDGYVSIGALKRGNREIKVEAKDEQGRVVMSKQYLVSSTKQIDVHEGEFVRAGKALSDGIVTPYDILKIKGPFAVQEYLLNEIQEVYRLQGIKISDKHIEVIVRQMMRKMSVEDPGDTHFLVGDYVDKFEFVAINDKIFNKKFITDKGDSEKYAVGEALSLSVVREENMLLERLGKQLMQYRDAVPAVASPILLGITRASLGVSSWMSAASFQETTKILSQAAIEGKVDTLIGLKENVIAGRLIPAGTGMSNFREIVVASRMEADPDKWTKEGAFQFDEEE